LPPMLLQRKLDPIPTSLKAAARYHAKAALGGLLEKRIENSVSAVVQFRQRSNT
jgi:hypothetical protein